MKKGYGTSLREAIYGLLELQKEKGERLEKKILLKKKWLTTSQIRGEIWTSKFMKFKDTQMN